MPGLLEQELEAPEMPSETSHAASHSASAGASSPASSLCRLPPLAYGPEWHQPDPWCFLTSLLGTCLWQASSLYVLVPRLNENCVASPGSVSILVGGPLQLSVDPGPSIGATRGL